MNLGWILLTIIIFLLVSKLISVFGKEPVSDKVRFISKKTGDILEMTLIPEKKDLVHLKKDAKVFDEEDFLTGAKMSFNAVVDAFSIGKVEDFKTLVSPRVYDCFVSVIEERKNKEQQVEFSLISFLSCKILNRSEEENPIQVTVEFITEQTNALKDKMGKVLEGDSVLICKVRDVWTFKRDPKFKNRWAVIETQSRAFDG